MNKATSQPLTAEQKAAAEEAAKARQDAEKAAAEEAALKKAKADAEKELAEAKRAELAKEADGKNDLLYKMAEHNLEGHTLVPADKVKGNHTVKAVEPRVERNGLVVVKRIA